MAEVSSFTIVLTRGAVYQKTFILTDNAGAPITLSYSQLDVTPVGAAAFSWTQANGRFTNVSPGVYDLDLSATDTQNFTWDNAVYHWSVIESGDANPCLIEGQIFVRDC